ncbi:DUF6653 family protein [Alteriqipengyuania sp.]|uniref:DUF6653 family protein n=1 Tax=Alteriqipengyuania sp. TaxID=2800692 RepID=UPI0035155D05
MSWENRLAALFGLDDSGWERHANPWSGWSRLFTGLPLIVLAIWSRAWIGWWSILPILLTIIWLWINPLLFPPPGDDRAWMSRGVFGERLWSRRKELALPEGSTIWPIVANAVTGLFTLALIYGLVVLDVTATLLGAVGTAAAKLAFMHLMARLYVKAKSRDPSLAYRASA